MPEKTKAPPQIKPAINPVEEPERRFSPSRVCPSQIERVIRRILPELP